jgi:hypothetical protein
LARPAKHEGKIIAIGTFLSGSAKHQQFDRTGFALVHFGQGSSHTQGRPTIMDEQKLKAGERIDLLRDDLTDTNVWLENKYPSDRFALMGDYYHHQKFGKDIAYVVILGPAQEKRRAIRATATQALIVRIFRDMLGSAC